MNLKNCPELKILAITLIETYGQKETENNWNDSAVTIRKLSNLLSSHSEKLEPQNEYIKIILSVLEQSSFSERTRLALDSIELLKNIALKITSDSDKSLYGLILSILLKICEKSNKIITKQAREAIFITTKANLNFISVTVPLIIDFGRDNCSRFARQICIEIIKEVIEDLSDPKILNYILTIASTYIRLSTTDSCDVVRATSRKILDHFKKYENNPFPQNLDTENSQKHSIIKNNTTPSPSVNRKKSDRSTSNVSVQKPKVLGKAQRVKIVP